MQKFIEVLGGDGTWHFINATQITKVSCEVNRMTRGGEFDPRSMLDDRIASTTPKVAVVVVTIRVLTANGEGEVKFNSESEADMWAVTELGIDDIILRSQTLDR